MVLPVEGGIRSLMKDVPVKMITLATVPGPFTLHHYRCLLLARHAMATRFELVLPGEDHVRLRAAGEEALDEVERLEAQLSLYRSSSEISDLNARAASGPVAVDPRLFRLLQRAKWLSEQTDGAFDITVGPLVRCWGFAGGTGKMCDPEELARAQEAVGMHRVELDEEAFTVHFTSPGVTLDLGAIGKGYALDRAADLLREAGVTSALLHGGTSTVVGLGAPPDMDYWSVAIQHPIRPSEPVATVRLRDRALSVSAVHGKAFEAEGRLLGHVIDPRSGHPVAGAQLAAVSTPSATDSDALSTALLVLGERWLPVLRERFPVTDAWVIDGESGQWDLTRLPQQADGEPQPR
jgi:thiamine biosynthesis lipoprotein